jgi:FkbM family methyltransferase
MGSSRGRNGAHLVARLGFHAADPPAARLAEGGSSKGKRMLTRDEVITGFRLLLGREPESERTIEFHRNYPSLLDFGRVLRESEEFQTRAVRERIAGGERACWVRAELPSGSSLWVNLHDDGVSSGILRGTWEPAETNFILSIVCPGDCVVDIGANLGWYTVILAQALGPDGHVFAFEPRSDLFTRLERSVRDNGFVDRCTLYRLALGTQEGQCNLAWSPAEMNPGHTFLLAGESPPEAAGLSHETVRVASLDGIGIDRRIRLIKIDVEGAELGALNGGRSLIARDRPVIVSEAFPKWLRRVGKTDMHTFLHAFDDLDYRAHYLTDDGIGGEVQWPIPDFDSDYCYYPIVFLGPADRAALLDGRRDGRVGELQSRVAELADSQQCLGRRADEAEGRAAELATEVDRLTGQLATAEARLGDAEQQAGALHADVQRLAEELSAYQARTRSAEHRARTAEFRNLELAGQVLRASGPCMGP